MSMGRPDLTGGTSDSSAWMSRRVGKRKKKCHPLHLINSVADNFQKETQNVTFFKGNCNDKGPIFFEKPDTSLTVSLH